MALLDLAPLPVIPAPAPVAPTPGDALPSGRPEGTGWPLVGRVMTRMVSAAGTVAVIGAILAFLFLAVGPRFLGYQTATMLTGSMAPGIVPGDVVVTTQQPVDGVRVGDVISYHIPVEDHRVETHRVIEVITNDDGTTAVRTKGDANEAVDPWIATLNGDYVYEQAFIIPGIGDVIRTLRTPIVNTVLVYGVPAVLVVGLLTMIWGRPATADAGGVAGAPEVR